LSSIRRFSSLKQKISFGSTFLRTQRANNRTMSEIIEYLIPENVLEDPPQTTVFAYATPIHYQDYTFNIAFLRNNLSLVFTGNGRLSFEIFILENDYELYYKRKSVTINGNRSYGSAQKILQKSLAQCVAKNNLRVRLILGADISCAVCGKVEDLSVCAGCNSISYCGKDHQMQHWSTHRLDCCRKRTDTMAAYLRKINSWERSGVLTVNQRDHLKHSLSECPVSVHESFDQMLVMQEVMEKKALEIFDLMEKLTKKNLEIAELKTDHQNAHVLMGEVQKRNEEIAELKGAVKKRNKKLSALNEKRDELERKMKEMKTKLKFKNSRLQELERDYKEMKKLTEEMALTRSNHDQEQEIEILKAKCKMYEDGTQKMLKKKQEIVGKNISLRKKLRESNDLIEELRTSVEDLDARVSAEVEAYFTLFIEVEKLKEENEELSKKLKSAKMKPLEAQSVAELHLTLKRVTAELEEREYQENCCQCCGDCPRISHAMIPCGHRFCSECIEMDVCPFCSSRKTAALRLY